MSPSTSSSTTASLRKALWPDGAKVPARGVTCRHCGSVNEIDVATAALEPEACECGACERALFLDGDEPLKGLPATEYQHPLDANSLRALKSVPGFDRGLKWLMEQVLDRSSRLQLMSSALRCGKDQFPKLRALADVASSRLGIDFPVTLYLVQQPVLNALTTGVEERAVVVHSAMLDQMTDDELVAIMGHELGHLHAEHQLYKTMASIIVMGGTAFFMPLRLLSIPLQLALAKWARCSELTSDRAGLLATRDLGASVRVLLKLIAGDSPGVAKRGPASIAALVKQARELEKMEGSSVLDGLMAALLTLRQTHPYPAWRLMHLLQWVESGSYLDIISGKYQRAPEKPEKKEPPKKTAA